MISLTPIIEVLQPKPLDFNGAWFRQVAGASEYSRVDAENIPTPTAWVVRSADRVTHAGERAEDVVLGFDVVIAVENAREHKAGETDDLLLKYRKAVKDLLLGWQFDKDIKPIKFNGGHVLRYDKKDLMWADSYIFEALITNYLPDPYPFEKAAYTGETL